MLCYSAPFPCTDVTVGSITNLPKEIFTKQLNDQKFPTVATNASVQMFMNVSSLQSMQTWKKTGKLKVWWLLKEAETQTFHQSLLKSCSVLLKLKKAKAHTTPLQKKEAVFGVGSACRACFKTLAFPLGGLGPGWSVFICECSKQEQSFPAWPWLHTSYGIQLRPLKNKAMPSIFLCSLAKSSARVSACTLCSRAALSVVCMYPLRLWPLGITGCRPACWLTCG